MAEETFEGFVARERERLNRERDAVFSEQQELEQKLAVINRELSAIDAYEAAKSGKAPASLPRTRAPRAGSGARRGSRRGELINLIRQHPEGLARKDILERMGLKGDKAGEMSVSNALTALVKAAQVVRVDGRYRVG
jgi:hypothetical protein